MDQELFGLCKEVYERTGWKTDGVAFRKFNDSEWAVSYDHVQRTLHEVGRNGK